MPNRKLCEVPGDGLKLSEAILGSHTMTTLRCLPLSWGFGVCPASWRVLARQLINGSQAEGALAQPIFDFAPKAPHVLAYPRHCLIYDVPVTKPCDLESVSYNSSYSIALPQRSALRIRINLALLDAIRSDWWRETLFEYLGPR